ncbi:MAG: hypothetical protein KatS3mg008_1243 [Acidimicrobiales bacterium]|nr:MAG: hypothetical protein KatS3mg008_1243 [Acidimicrobiales bacterium]
MNGAELVMRTAVANGVDVCFANPGTSEMHLVAALDTVPGMRAVLGLFEGVCTGAADGYGRMTGKPALTILHLGPGLGNGIANLHNARRASSPVVNLIGDHATWHLDADAPLTSDIVSLAQPVSRWVHTAKSARSLGEETANAIAAAVGPPSGVASLIVPADLAWEEVPEDAAAPSVETSALPPDEEAVAEAARMLREPGAVLFVGGRALDRRGLTAAARVRAATGCRVVQETFSARLERAPDLPTFDRVPYFPEQAAQELANVRVAVLAGAPEPVAFFGYPHTKSRMLPDDARRIPLSSPETHPSDALEALAEHLGAPAYEPSQAPEPCDPPVGGLDITTLARAIAAVQPEGLIVVDEAATSGIAYPAVSAGSPPHTVLGLTGGSIGMGLPCAVGAAIACPDRKVLAFQADGSAMYTSQALWTMAREGLDVCVLICANRKYAILQIELMRAGVTQPGPNAAGLTDLTRPTIDFVKLAEAHGVPGVRVDTAEATVDALRNAFSEPGPHLIEAVIG